LRWNANRLTIIILNLEFVFEYPVWYFIFCIALGLLFSWLLYRKLNSFKDAKSWLVKVLFAIRFAGITLISFLLLSPLLKYIQREVDKPIIVLIQDNSESILQKNTGKFIQKDYAESLKQLVKKLEENYQVDQYSFSDKITDSINLNFNGKQTDISNALVEINNSYLNRNVGAIILASDGIINKGANPIYIKNILKAPIYTIALGDTTIQRDLLIHKVNQNQIAYLNNTFPIEVLVDAKKLQGKFSELIISQNGKNIASQNLTIENNNWTKSFQFLIKAEKIGIQKYSIYLKTISGEFTTLNNQRDIYIDVIDSRQKVLLLSASPHPDVAAIKLAIQSNDNYEVNSFLVDNFDGNLKDYSLVFLHQIPSKNTNDSKLFADLENFKLPLFFIVGEQTSLGNLNTLQNIVQLTAPRGNSNNVTPFFNEGFSLYTISDELKKSWQNIESLNAPFCNYKVLPGANIFLKQKIGSVNTDYPLLAFNGNEERKMGILLAEGIWKWRLQDYSVNTNHNLFNEFVFKLIQYLSVRTEKKNLSVISRKSFFENEAISFEAEVYNASFELVNTPDVFITVTDSAQKKYQFTFSKTQNAYKLDAGIFPSGYYSYEAKTSLSGKVFLDKGSFLIKPVVEEITNTTANHLLLKDISSRNNGAMVLSNNMMSLSDLIGKREDVKSVSHSEISLNEMINLKWLFFLILTLLSIEWFLRKRNGSY
jgi:hypothetical protein